MGCVSPRQAWWSKSVNRDTGNRPITFNRQDAYVDRPIEVPCRKCIGCAMVKRAEWAVRCFHEASQHDQNSFVTLTYDDEHVPDTLRKEDLQRFFRRLRDTGNRFRYFACGEYGEVTRRPHYHALMFGMDFLGGAVQMGTSEYFSPVLAEAWGKGHCQVGLFSIGAACYVAGYVSKKMGDDDSFQVMSRRPGVGHNWLDRYGMDIFADDCVVIDGKRFPIPKRYLSWLELEEGPPTPLQAAARRVASDRRSYFSRLSDTEKALLPRKREAQRLNYLAKASLKRSVLA